MASKTRKLEDGFDVFFLDGFSWTDLLDFMFIPHYSNSNRCKQPIRSYKIMSIRDEDVLVLWENRAEPSLEEINVRLDKDDSEE